MEPGQILWSNDRYRLVLNYDEDGQNPRTNYEQLGVLVLRDNRHVVGDDNAEAKQARGWLNDDNPTAEEVRENFGAKVALGIVVRPDWASTLALANGREPDGYIFDTPASRELCGTPDELIENALIGELDEYNDYLRGDVFSAVLEEQITWTPSRPTYDKRATWEVIDSLSGLIGLEHAQESAFENFPEADYTEQKVLVGDGDS